MAIEYDLVILGGTPEGIDAAARATQLGARVALVLQGLDGRRSPLLTHGLFTAMQTPPAPVASPLSPWQRVRQRAHLIADALTSEDFQRLMVQGCDVIAETAQWLSDRPLTLATAARQFTTRAVLLATGSHPAIPAIAGLATVPYETPDTLLRRETLPQTVAILGGSPEGMALAQLLRRWGVGVTLMTPQPRLLSQEDADVSDWITAQLTAEGVDLHLNALLTEVVAVEGGIMLKLPHKMLTTDALVMATQALPNLVNIGLEPWLRSDRPLAVNAFLRTQHPRIYACGAVLGGYEAPAIARQEAHIAVANAIFWNHRRINYRSLPYALPTHPEMARVGLTEAQALQRYGRNELLIARQTLYENPQAQWRESTTGFCKLIAHRDGALLGGHGVGPEASAWIQTIAWCMHHAISWKQLVRSPVLPDSLTSLLQQASQQWERDRWQHGQWRRDWAENWCNWRRSC